MTQTDKEARRAKVKKFQELVKAMAPEQRQALADKYGYTTIEGRSLSVYNQCLIAMQKHDCTVLGGFRQWIRAGRVVSKGQHGIAIWVPIGQRTEGASEETLDNQKPGFILGNVFDISQTEPMEQGATNAA